MPVGLCVAWVRLEPFVVPVGSLFLPLGLHAKWALCHAGSVTFGSSQDHLLYQLAGVKMLDLLVSTREPHLNSGIMNPSFVHMVPLCLLMVWGLYVLPSGIVLFQYLKGAHWAEFLQFGACTVIIP